MDDATQRVRDEGNANTGADDKSGGKKTGKKSKIGVEVVFIVNCAYYYSQYLIVKGVETSATKKAVKRGRRKIFPKISGFILND